MEARPEFVAPAPLHLDRVSAELRQPCRIHFRGDDGAAAKTATNAHSVDHHPVPAETERVGEAVADEERILGPCPDLQAAILVEPGDGRAGFDRGVRGKRHRERQVDVKRLVTRDA